MPSGKTHTKVTSITALLMLFHPEYGKELMIGGFLGTILTPDLDLIETVNVHPIHILQSLFPRWVSKIFKFYWKFYGVISPHRYYLSHFPIVSTWVRVVYQFWFIFLVIFLESTQNLVNFIENKENLYILYGLFLVDFIHILLDIFSSFFNKIFKGRMVK